jgi:DNA-binding SARP family transcriptional activator
VRLQEWWDARLVIHENPPIGKWTYANSRTGKSTRVWTISPGPSCSTRRRERWRSRLRAFAFAVWFLSVASLAWGGTADASHLKQSALDQIEQSYQISVTIPSTGLTLPSVLFVGSATLDTTNTQSGVDHAPRGKIYLSLQMNSGPAQRQYGQINWGSFFSEMTPLPASAIRYVAASGHNYTVTRVNPINQVDNFNAATDDGMVDATYYFTIPISNRRGTVIISSCRTTGSEYTGFVGGSPVPLDIGGPTRIALSFPAKLTETKSVPNPSVGSASRTSATTFTSVLNLLSTLLAVILVSFFLLARRNKKRRRQPKSVIVLDRSTEPQPTPSPVFVEQPPRSADPGTRVHRDVAETPSDATLRIDVLGPLTISPTFAPPSDPVRAILAYLAMNHERVLTLEEIQNAIWPLTERGTDIKKPAMRNYMMQARRCVGEHHLPTASGRPGYQLQHFDTDWGEFQRLLGLATKAPRAEATILRRRALALAKGLPFTADTTRYFTWTFSTSVVYKIVESVTVLAHVLCTELVLTGDLAGAQVVVRQGLLTDPASLALWEDLTDVLLESTDQSLLDLHWKAADLVLRSEDVVLLRGRANG